MTASDLTVYGLLRRGAKRWGEREFVLFEDGSRWSRAGALREGARAANALAAHGVGRGDRVMVLLPNGASWLRAWWGATLLGAVTVPVNPAYRGGMLADVCDTVSPRVIVAGDPTDRHLADRHRDLLVAPEALLDGADVVAELDPVPEPWDTHCLLMTSGTTGPSKASITTHKMLCTLADYVVDECGVGEDDVFLGDMPWYHLSSLSSGVQIMRCGGKVAVRTVPAMSTYWATAKAVGATFSIAPGTVAQFLLAQPETVADRDHAMRFVLSAPLPPDPADFIRRFGLEGVASAYGSTEANICVVTTLATEPRAGACGVARRGFQIRIVDEHDSEVPVGEVGELIVRTDEPWFQTQGYFGNPEATVALLRNGWVHTGDALRMDEDGYYSFHDRYKDALRRRGENISSFEVEREVAGFAGVAEVACVAHPGEFGADDEVKVFIRPADDAAIDFPALLAFLVDRMAHFMVPRFYELIAELPKTPTLRVQKHLLRGRGNSAETWDRVAAGYQVTRNGLVTPAPAPA